MAPPVKQFSPDVSAPVVEELVETLCRAFDRDAHINWIIRQDRLRARAFRQFFRMLLTDMTAQGGEIFATEDLKAAAILFPPGQKSLNVRIQARLALRFASITGWSSLPIKAYGLNRMEARHPGQPHYFLQTLGVDPACQGRGYGSALLAAMLAKWDAEGLSAYLETSSSSNLDFYCKHGFQVWTTAQLPRGPMLWQLLRPGNPEVQAP